jgi:hypothetical protein
MLVIGSTINPLMVISTSAALRASGLIASMEP